MLQNRNPLCLLRSEWQVSLRDLINTTPSLHSSPHERQQRLRSSSEEISSKAPHFPIEIIVAVTGPELSMIQLLGVLAAFNFALYMAYMQSSEQFYDRGVSFSKDGYQYRGVYRKPKYKQEDKGRPLASDKNRE